MLQLVRRYVNIKRLYATSTVAYAESIELLGLESNKDRSSEDTRNVIQVNMLEINSKLKELIRSGHLNEARQMFDELPHRDEVSCTYMISAYVNSSCSFQALTLFSKIRAELSLQMDPFLLSLAFKACAIDSNVHYGESLHGYSIKTGLVNSVFVGSAILDMYTKTGKIWESCRFFEGMPLRNAVSWTTMITGLVRSGYPNDGLLYFAEMWRAGVEYDSFTFAIALKACADILALDRGKEIHAQAMKGGFDVSSFVANSLVSLYNRCGKLDYGLCLFEKMRTQDVVSWTTMIMTYVQMGKEKHAIQAFLHMQELNVCPNEYTCATIISGCANIAQIDWGEQLHALVIQRGLSDFVSVSNALMSLYSKCRHLPSASVVFYGMTTRDIVSWSTIIAGYANEGCGHVAFEFLTWMKRDGPEPTDFALASVLSVCGNMAILEQGKQLHAYALTIGLDHKATIRSALITMYSKCGSVGEATNLFSLVENDDIVSCTAMINGYAEHGYSQQAIHLFEEVTKAGLIPDSVTFIGILSACCHAGLVDLGFHYFNLMRNSYGIFPSKEHYGCMIDLLCRAGRLQDAEHMIESMPFEGDDVVWSTLLRACRIHGDVECGRQAAEKILELDPHCATTHITLANIYSAKGQWREAADVRKMMRLKGVMKEPGWSWIKVRDQVSAFVAGDRSHPQCEDIYSILKLVASKAEIEAHEMVFSTCEVGY